MVQSICIMKWKQRITFAVEKERTQLIQEKIKIHDKFQFELKLDYPVLDKEKKTTYHIRTYFFIPKNLDINDDNYSKNDFFKDVLNYIRFKTPVVMMKRISLKKENFLSKLKEYSDRLLTHPTLKNKLKFEYSIKLLGAILRRAVRIHVDNIIAAKTPQQALSLTNKYIRYVNDILSTFRELMTEWREAALPDKLERLYHYADEYISLELEKQTFQVLGIVQRRWQNQWKNRKTIQVLRKIIEDELEYRNKQGYPSLPNSNRDHEEVLFRASMLKKIMGSILYLDVQKKKDSVYLEQFILSVAAGIAMIFATGVSFYWHLAYGGFTVSLFLILVVSYMLKDRIKELARMFFSAKLKRYTFNRKLFVYSEDKQKIGVFRDNFNYVSENNLPSKIRNVRDIYNTKDVDPDWIQENIIQYQKFVKIYSKDINFLFEDYPVTGIIDIMRFNVASFLRRMENPQKTIHLLNDKGSSKVYANKVYHINIVIGYESGQSTKYNRFRLVLDRNGIKRIEEVYSEV